MAKKSLDLVADTPREWVNIVTSNFDILLADHANCERKASAMAMSMVMKYPDRTDILPDLIAVAREELDHFEQVYAVMCERGQRLSGDRQDPYVVALLKLMRQGRDERFLDRLLIASVIECRGAERFRLIAESESLEPQLQRFYRQLWASEAKHGHIFVEMALRYFAEDVVYERLEDINRDESTIMQAQPIQPFLH